MLWLIHHRAENVPTTTDGKEKKHMMEAPLEPVDVLTFKFTQRANVPLQTEKKRTNVVVRYVTGISEKQTLDPTDTQKSRPMGVKQ